MLLQALQIQSHLRLLEMFKETNDVKFLNYICNHPDVRAGGENDLDVSVLVGNSIAYSYDNGAIIYVIKSPGVYEAHTQALKSGRGKILRKFIAWTLDDLFNKKGAKEVKSYAYHTNPSAKRLALEFLKPNGSNDSTDFFRVTREEYLCQLQRQSQ